MKHVYVGMDYNDKTVVRVTATDRGRCEFPSTQLTLDDGSVVYEGPQWGQGEPTMVSAPSLEEVLRMTDDSLPFVKLAKLTMQLEEEINSGADQVTSNRY